MITSKLQVGKVESVLDEILLLDPQTTPLLSLVGIGQPVYNTTHMWYEDAVFAAKSTVNGAKTAADTAVVVVDVEPFRENQVVTIGEEMLLVTAVNASTSTLTVQRGYAGTTAAAITNGAEIEVAFVRGVEGADARKSRYKSRVKRSNLTQIFDDTIKVSGSAAVVLQHGVDDEYEKEKQKVQKSLVTQLEKAAIVGRSYEEGEDIRFMGGIRSLIVTNVKDADGQAVSIAHIEQIAKAIDEAGGFSEGSDSYKIMVHSTQKLNLSKISGGAVRIEQGNNERGDKVDFIVTEYGRFEIIRNNNLAPSELFLIDKNRISVRPLGNRDFQHEYLGKKGDSFEGQIVGEFTLEFLEEAAHARIKNLAV